MTQGDSGRDCVNSLELCQQSICEDGTTEHSMSYLVTPQEIDKSSSVESISNPYQPENGYSSATSQDSANLYSISSQDAEDFMDFDQEISDQHQRVLIPDMKCLSPVPERRLADPKYNPVPLPSSCKQNPLKISIVHHPKDCPENSAWGTDAQGSQTMSRDRSRTLAVSADEASQAIASDLSNADYRSQEEIESVIRAKVLSLLKGNKISKRNPPCSSGTDLGALEKRLQCQFCDKKKRTQCDLTYVNASPIWTSRPGRNAGMC